MDFWSVLLISLVGGSILVVGGGVLLYMASLVKNAYQIKVEIHSEMEEGLRRIEDDMDKRSKWVKRDLIEEIDKIRTAILTDNAKRFNEISDDFNARLREVETRFSTERADLMKVIDNHRQTILSLDQRLRTIKRQNETSSPAAAAAVEETVDDPVVSVVTAAGGFQPLPLPDARKMRN